MSIRSQLGNKKAAHSRAAHYLHLHFAMTPEAMELLRAATIQALQNQQDEAASELLSLMEIKTKPVLAALPSARRVLTGEAHDYHYWTRIVREQFIPFMTANGRLRFTSHELLTWLENCTAIDFSTGDFDEHESGRHVWRNAVSGALAALKKQGILDAPAFGKDYTIRTQSLPAAV